MDLSLDSDEDLIDVPCVPKWPFLALKASTRARPRLHAPAANRFKGQFYAAFPQQLLDIAEALAEAMVDPDGIADNLAKEPMAMVTGFALIHRISVPEGALIKWYSTGKTAFTRTSTFLRICCQLDDRAFVSLGAWACAFVSYNQDNRTATVADHPPHQCRSYVGTTCNL